MADLTIDDKEYKKLQQQLQQQLHPRQEPEGNSSILRSNLQRQIAGTTIEVGSGIGLDIATQGLLGFGPLGWIGYGAINFAGGVLSNYTAQQLREVEKLGWGELLSSGFAGIIPYATHIKGLKGAKAVGGVALESAIRTPITEQLRVGIDEKRRLTPGEIGTSAVVGGALGGGFQGAITAAPLINKMKNQIITDTLFGLPAKTVHASFERPAKRTHLNWRKSFNVAKMQGFAGKEEGLNQRLVIGWGLRGKKFEWDQYIARRPGKGSAARRELGADVEDVQYLNIGTDSFQAAQENVEELRKFYGPLFDIGMGRRSFQLHHEVPLLASLPGYDGLIIGEKRWWDVTEVLFENGLRPGDHPRNLIPVIGGSKPSFKGEFPTPHSATHKYLDDKVGEDGTKFWTQDVRDRMNGRGEWEGKGPDDQFRKDKWQEYSEIVLKSKQITAAAVQTFEDIYKRDPKLKFKRPDPIEIDLLVDRLSKLDADGLLPEKFLEAKWQVTQMRKLALDVIDDTESIRSNMMDVRAWSERIEQVITPEEFAELSLPEQLKSISKLTGMPLDQVETYIRYGYPVPGITSPGIEDINISDDVNKLTD